MTTCSVDIQIPFEKIGEAKRVGIQLPNGLKRRAAEIAEEIERKGYEVIISGESCFGACDIDLALLNEVDVLLHFAHTPILKMPRVIYVPYFVDYDTKIELNIPERKIALIATAQYCHKLGEVKDWLEKLGYEVELRKGSGRVVYSGQVLGCNYTALKGSKADAVLFIGDGVFHAIGAAIYTSKKVYAYNPLTRQLSAIDASEFLKKRYIAISKCVGCKRVGIIVSSKPGQKRLQLGLKLKAHAEKAGISAHIVYINDITPEKLYNLPYEFYVNTACPRISYDDAARYEKPILTPPEFEFLVGLKSEIEVDEID